MIHSRLTLMLSLGSLAGCVHTSSAKNQEGIVRASYVWGPEVNTMKPCGSDSTFWVLAKPEIIGRLRTAHDSLRTQPYEGIFIRVQGQRSAQPTDGFAEETNGYFEVTEIVEVRRLREGECG
jgi:hypothetical protein